MFCGVLHIVSHLPVINIASLKYAVVPEYALY